MKNNSVYLKKRIQKTLEIRTSYEHEAAFWEHQKLQTSDNDDLFLKTKNRKSFKTNLQNTNLQNILFFDKRTVDLEKHKCFDCFFDIKQLFTFLFDILYYVIF